MCLTNVDGDLNIFERDILQSPGNSYNVQLKLYDIFIPALAIVVIGINSIIIFSSGLILKKRLQPRSTYIFLGNVALADMMAGVSTLVGQYYPKEKRSEMMCSIQIGFIISPTLASVYSIALIAFDRYLYILYGLQYQRYLSTKRARFMSIGTWILGGLVGFLPVMGIRENVYHESHLCWLILVEPKSLVLVTVTIGITPLVIIIILYSIILKHALGKISEMRELTTISAKVSSNSDSIQLRYFRGKGNTNTIKDENNVRINSEEDRPVRKHCLLRLFKRHDSANISSVYSPSRWKAIKIVLFTTGCFFITWFPYFIACALYAFCDKGNSKFSCNGLRVAIASPLAILGLSNSLLNPIIYAWWHNGFRESVKRIYSRWWQQRVKSKQNIISQDKSSKQKQHVEPLNRVSSLSTLSTEARSSGAIVICHL